MGTGSRSTDRTLSDALIGLDAAQKNMTDARASMVNAKKFLDAAILSEAHASRALMDAIATVEKVRRGES